MRRPIGALDPPTALRVSVVRRNPVTYDTFGCPSINFWVIPMTHLLQQALGEVQKLPDADQDAIAALILAELEDERKWDEQFARSQPQLARLAEKVREDIQAGRALKMDVDEL
jgi:hypothetical protein